MNSIYIIDNDDIVLDIQTKFGNYIKINHISNVKTLDYLISTLINVINSKEFKKENTTFIFSKPDEKYIEFIDKHTHEYIYIDKTTPQDDTFFKTYVNNLTSEDGSYEKMVIDVKFDFLLDFLDLENVNYKVIEFNNSTQVIEYLSKINKNVI